MFWFWFWWTMLVLDVVWWAVIFRLTKSRFWRVLVSAFMTAQIVVLLSLLCEADWRLYPKAVLVLDVVWHRIGLPLAFAGVLLLGIARVGQRIRGRIARDTRLPNDLPTAAHGLSSAQTRREFIGAVTAVAPCLFTLGAAGVSLKQIERFRVRRFVLSIPALPRALNGLSIAHVSDLHIGPWTSSQVAREIIKAANALRPDLVLLTGDLIDYELASLSDALSVVKAMESRYGQWMIEGNHDLFEDGGEFAQRVKAAGVPLLLDDSAVADVRGHPVQFFGLRWLGPARGDDPERDRLIAMQMHTVLRHREPEAFPILLAHHPHTFDAAAKADLPLTLAGHTHGGQWMFNSRRGVGPVLFRYWSGLYQRGRSQMIVSNGAGNVFPLRVNAPAEIVHITLRCV